MIEQAERQLALEAGNQVFKLLHHTVPVTLRYDLPRTMSYELDFGLSSVWEPIFP